MATLNVSVVFNERALMRVLIVLPSLANKAPIKVAHGIVDGLVSIGVTCEVWYFDKIEEIIFNCPAKRINFFSKSLVGQFDIIHSHGIRPDAWVAKLRIFGNKVPSVSTIHNYVDEDLRYGYGWLVGFVFAKVWRYFWKFQTRLVVLSEHAKSYYKNLSKYDQKIVVVGNGVPEYEPKKLDDNDINKINDLKKNQAFIFGACAQLMERKGLDQMISALQKHPDCGLILVGDGPSFSQLKKMTQSLGIAHRCFFTGFRHNARDFIPYFDAVVIPSRSEGFPLAFIEATAAGKATILSDIPVFREISSERVSVFFELDDLDSLDFAIINVKSDALKLGKQARELYESRFTVEKMAMGYQRCYIRLLNIANNNS
jgi:glycosyltransferase involved in cell wall biosynthesis